MDEQEREQELSRLARLATGGVIMLRNNKGHLEKELHDMQKLGRLPYSAENMLGLMHEMDSHIDGILKWLDELKRD